MRKQAALAEEPEQESVTDEVTGGYAPWMFTRLLEAELGRSDWRGHACSVLIGQIDGFDVLQQKGDDTPTVILRAFAQEFQQHSRPGDIMGRSGEAELALILPETGIPDAEEVSRKILSGQAWHVTASVGVACFPVHAANSADLLGAARAAMEVAAQRGGNMVLHLDDALPGAREPRAVY